MIEQVDQYMYIKVIHGKYSNKSTVFEDSMSETQLNFDNNASNLTEDLLESVHVLQELQRTAIIFNACWLKSKEIED